MTPMLHIIHMVRDLDIASGGPSRSVPALAASQSNLPDTKVIVLYQDRGNPVVELDRSRVDYKAIDPWKLLPGEGFLQDFLSDDDVAGRNCIFHLHGLWSPTLHWVAGFAAKNHIPYVISTRGMLATWCLGHKSLKKKLGWWLYQKRDIENAACLLATSESEKKDVSALVPGKRVAVIPNGCDEGPERGSLDRILSESPEVRWALAMGRLHPVKGFAELIETWGATMPQGSKLAIAGPDEDGYRATLEALIRDRRLLDRVVLLGEVDDRKKWSLLNQCELFAAPSKTENFGMAIAEALQSGTPVITTTGTPWREINDYHCGWWVEPGHAALKSALLEATGMDDAALKDMGRNGGRLITDKYSWNQIAARTVELYLGVSPQSNNVQ